MDICWWFHTVDEFDGFEEIEFVIVDEDIPRFDRFEFTHVAPVAVNGWEVFTVDDEDDVERVEIFEEFVVPTFLVEIFDERILLDGISDIEESKNKNIFIYSKSKKLIYQNFVISVHNCYYSFFVFSMFHHHY